MPSRKEKEVVDERAENLSAALCGITKASGRKAQNSLLSQEVYKQKRLHSAL